jgi:hypothetical protein
MWLVRKNLKSWILYILLFIPASCTVLHQDPAESPVSQQSEALTSPSPRSSSPSPPLQTAIAETQAAFPISGGVEFEEGICCVGGIAGEIIEIEAAFWTENPHGEVTEMRISREPWACHIERSLEVAAWEPYTPRKALLTLVAINWQGSYLRVQYRDAMGNLSPIYCDDISIEGMPSRTTTP